MPNHLNPPHGGVLVDPMAAAGRVEELRAASRDWPSWDLTPRQVCDLELILNGGFSPLDGFMTREQYEAVVEGHERPSFQKEGDSHPVVHIFLAAVREYIGKLGKLVAEYRKEEHYPELEALGQWMSEHAALFTNKTNMQHLKTSLYARVFQYLYPRRVLTNAFCQQHKDDKTAIAEFRAVITAKDVQGRESKRRELEDWLKETLPASIEGTIQKLKGLYDEAEWNTIVADARQTLLDHTAYYLKVLSGQETIEVEPEPIEEEGFELEEDTND